MKKYLSVFSVIARESIYRISLLWLISAALQTAVFYVEMNSEHVQKTRLIAEAFSPYGDKICIPLIFALTFLLTGILLMKTGMEFRTKTGYTLRRLLISEKQVFVIQAVYNFIMILLLFVFETALCFILSNWGTAFIDAQFITNQTVYLTFYSSEFISNMFAGRDVMLIVRNIIIMLSVGVNLSLFSYSWRRGKKYIFGVLVLVVAGVLFWWSPDYSYVEDITFSAVALGSLLIALGVAHTRREEYDS